VTFFPKPKKVTKERFALRWAFLARGGWCVDNQPRSVIKVLPDFVFAAELLWCLLQFAGTVAATGRRLEKQTTSHE